MEESKMAERIPEANVAAPFSLLSQQVPPFELVQTNALQPLKLRQMLQQPSAVGANSLPISFPL
jgi:hypothetical protein